VTSPWLRRADRDDLIPKRAQKWLLVAAAAVAASASALSAGEGATGSVTDTPRDAIVFSSDRASANPGEIYVLALGAPVRNVSRSPYAEQSLTSANTGAIAFVSRRVGRSVVVVADRTGARPHAIYSTTSAISARISPDGSRVVTWSASGAALSGDIIDVSSRAVRRFQAPCSSDLRWSPDTTRLLCLTSSERVLMLDLRGHLLASLRGIDAEWIAPHGLALVPRAFTTQLIRSTGVMVATLAGDPFAVSRNGRLVALAKAGLLVIVDGRTGRRVRTLTGPRSWTTSGAFTPDGRELAYFAPDSSFRAVSVSGRNPARKLPTNGVWSNDGHAYAFLRVDFAAGRVAVLVGGRYGEHAHIVGQFDWDDHGDSTLVSGTGGRFLYETSVRAHGDLWSIRPDGSDLHRLTRSGDARDPTWSPHGDRLAYAKSRYSGSLCGYCSPQVVIARPGGKEITTLPSDEEDANPAWSPDGLRLAVEHGLDGEIDVVDLDGRNRRRLVAEAGFAPAWSPDGKTIAYTAYDRGDGIHLVSAAGGSDRLLVADGSAPAWSPDGSLLAFVRRGVIFVTPLIRPGRSHRVAAGDQPAFSPSGATIAFSRQHGISVVGIDGSGLRRLTTTAYDDSAPAWRPRA
jgi:TolB protein